MPHPMRIQSLREPDRLQSTQTSAVGKGSNATGEEKKKERGGIDVGLWEKRQRFISFMEENEVKRTFGLTGEVKVCHRMPANTGSEAAQTLRGEGCWLKEMCGSWSLALRGKCQPGSSKHPQPLGVSTDFLSMC